MDVAIGARAAVGTPHAHVRQSSFGALVSAIKRGDLEAAGSAFDALAAFAPEKPNWSRKEPLEALSEAIKAQDLEAAKDALKEYQQSRAVAKEETVPPASTGLAVGGTFSILA
jgi:hypothetical protein